MTEYPKMLYAPTGRGTVTVSSPEDEAARLDAGFTTAPRAVHQEPQRLHAPEIPAGAALTEAHVPAIVEAVFERLKGMAVAAAEGDAHREGIAALHDGLSDRFDALKADLLSEMRALIAPAPAAGKKL